MRWLLKWWRRENLRAAVYSEQMQFFYFTHPDDVSAEELAKRRADWAHRLQLAETKGRRKRD